MLIKDRSLFHYGAIYHRLIDGKLEEARQAIIDLVPEGSSVLDIGCGTGELCLELCQQKHCKVVGLDLSLKMIRFADKHNSCQDVKFVHGDATDLSIFEDRSFDFAVMLVFIHEHDAKQQKEALSEALRVANKLIICDSVAPLPRNKGGFLIWLAETLFGHEHILHFKRFLAQGGIRGLLRATCQPVKIDYSRVFWYGAREVVVVSRTEQSGTERNITN
ncbi:MAG: methyltransferase domain-containing protein [bacterium]